MTLSGCCCPVLDLAKSASHSFLPVVNYGFTSFTTFSNLTPELVTKLLYLRDSRSVTPFLLRSQGTSDGAALEFHSRLSPSPARSSRR